METTLQDAPATPASEDERRDALTGRLFGGGDGGDRPLLRLPRRPARAVRRPGRARRGDARPARGGQRLRRPLRARVAGAPGDHRHRRGRDGVRRRRGAHVPAAGRARRGPARPVVPRLHRAARACGGRRRPGDAAARGGVPQRRRHRVRRLRPRPDARAGRAQPAAVRGAPDHRVHPGAAGRRPAPARAAAGTRPRRGVRHRVVEHRHRTGLRRRHRRRPGRRCRLDRRGTRERRRGGPRGSGAPGARRLHAAARRPVRPGDDPRGAARPAAPRRDARGGARRAGAGRCRARDGRARARTPSAPSGTRWSASCTASASSTACPWGGRRTGAAATGTVMRTPTLRRYAEQAGFASVDGAASSTTPCTASTA